MRVDPTRLHRICACAVSHRNGEAFDGSMELRSGVVDKSARARAGARARSVGRSDVSSVDHGRDARDRNVEMTPETRLTARMGDGCAGTGEDAMTDDARFSLRFDPIRDSSASRGQCARRE